MRFIKWIFLLLAGPGTALAQQKTHIEDIAHVDWPWTYYVDGSPKGKYHVIQVYGLGQERYIVADAEGKHVRTIPGHISNYALLEDEHMLLTLKADSLVAMSLRGMPDRLVAKDVRHFEVIGKTIVWKQDEKLALQTLQGAILAEFGQVTHYFREERGKALIIIRKTGPDASAIVRYGLPGGKPSVIWNGPSIDAGRQPVSSGEGFTFITKESAAEHLYFFNYSSKKAERISPDTMRADEQIVQQVFIPGNVYFTIERKEVRPVVDDPVGVNIWHYNDKQLQPEQLNLLKENKGVRTNYFYNITLKKRTPADRPGYHFPPDPVFSRGQWAVYIQGKQEPWFLHKKDKRSILLLNTSTGKEECVQMGTDDADIIGITPDGNYVIWYDFNKDALISYDIAARKPLHISASLPQTLYDEGARTGGRNCLWGIAGWIPESRALLMYDEFDIWSIRYDVPSKPQNITAGEGRKNRLVLKVQDERNAHTRYFSGKASILLSGFDRNSKNGGYWDWKISGNNKFPLDHLQPYSVDTRSLLSPKRDVLATGSIAKYGGTYWVTRETAAEARNVYITKDLVNYQDVTGIHPEKTYDWMTADLITWTKLDGKSAQGILYKPDGFDPGKKYPVIFHYYERMSDGFHRPKLPRVSGEELSIAAFVNMGYLVFIPDITYTPGRVGIGLFNTLESAAMHLSAMPYVDSTRLGLQGFSFGGWQTNYMLTHSRRFAAACESAGTCNHVAGYNQLSYGIGLGRQEFYETGAQGSPYGFDVTPMNSPSLYIQNSPIFKVEDVTAPLLMMHGRNDFAVPFEQAIEMFMGMRRAGKKVWLLHYDEAGHQLDGAQAEDYQRRMIQFFDHYLRGKPAPLWMTEGIEARYKGIKAGFELDMSGRKP